MRRVIAGDWGTSRLRVTVIEDGVPVARHEGTGIAFLPGSAADALRAILDDLDLHQPPDAILLCGMVGSRNGWLEVPYTPCPVARELWRAQSGRTSLDGVPVTIAAGAAFDGDDLADVMRGEETQIFGALVIDPRLKSGRHRLVLPGTHSKWATVEDGRIVAIRTFVTGELFELIRSHSTLLRVGDAISRDDENAGFDAGLQRADAGLPLASLFTARVAQLRQARSSDWAAGYTSGLLIGSEVREALTLEATGECTLIGAPTLTRRYAQALARRDVASAQLDGDACGLAGLQLLDGRDDG
jgi:2-dehydro-3-deoxygalactonokinase